MESSVNTELLRSRVDTFILNSLNEQDGYGYDILNYIYTKTQGHYEMKQSSIYSVLKRLEKQGYIKSYLGDESKGGQRRYYSLTDEGRAFLDAEQQQWAYTRTLLDNLVTQKDFDLEKDTPPFKASDLRPLTKRSRSDETQADDAPKQETPEIAQKNENAATVNNTVDSPKIAQSLVEPQTVPTPAPVFPQESNKEQLGLVNPSPLAASLEQPQSSFQYSGLQQQARERLFSPQEFTPVVNNEVQPASAEKTIPDYKEQRAENDDRTAYRTLFNELYDKKPEDIKPAPTPSVDEELSCHHINDLKNILKNEGYTLKTYKKDEMLCDYSRNRMYYSNRLFRDCTLLTFLFYTLAVLIIYRFRVEFGYSGLSLLVVGLCGLAIPLLGIIRYLIEPKKRVKAAFNFKIIFSYSIMAFLLVFVLNLIISLVTPSIGLTLRDLKLYPPAILALMLPFSVVFYQILFKSGFYNIKI